MESTQICKRSRSGAVCKAPCKPAGAERRHHSQCWRAFPSNRVPSGAEWEMTWVLGCIVGESGVEWDTSMVMHRGTRVAGLLPPSHPGSEFARPHENP